MTTRFVLLDTRMGLSVGSAWFVGRKEFEMTTDRELLEGAARAAGIDFQKKSVAGCLKTKDGELWNPLTDDGDALRLAVKLSLNLYLSDYGSLVVDAVDPITFEFGDGCPFAATRRAIVRAAYEIGKGEKLMEKARKLL